MRHFFWKSLIISLTTVLKNVKFHDIQLCNKLEGCESDGKDLLVSTPFVRREETKEVVRRWWYMQRLSVLELAFAEGDFLDASAKKKLQSTHFADIKYYSILKKSKWIWI